MEGCVLILGKVLDLVNIPIALCHISAGFVSPALDFQEPDLSLEHHIIINKEHSFYAVVEDNSMVDAGIHPHDVIIVDRLLHPKNNNIVICDIDGELTLKTYRIQGRNTFLQTIGKDCQLVEVTSFTTSYLWGVVTYTLKNNIASKSLITAYRRQSAKMDFNKAGGNLEHSIIKNKLATYYAIIQGNSMVDKNILPEDIVIIDRSLDAKNGNIVICELDGILTIKTFRKRNGAVLLEAANKHYLPLELNEFNRCMLWGVVIYTLKNNLYAYRRSC